MKDAERNKLFQLAFEDFHAMRYDLALRGFQDIIEQYPETETAEEASFWSAECFYAQKKTDEAEAAYKAYIRDFPDGVKSCVALYKLGVVYAEKEQQKAANLVWNKLLEQCPDSQEAITAKQRLADH